ncbi:MAG TPA: pyridoxamine 5'-phosphate oxidase [Candidatus Cybelea sp.]|nr:pyridoxamine 5'-phosphate oxidase [Candidatus Cybelea sp.]
MSEPFALLARWIEDAGGMESVEAIAMCLATADSHAQPSARIVLLRGVDARGLRFFTSYLSRKGRELAENPHAAAVLYWPNLHRQVRVEGDVVPLSDDESDAYFNARPRGHQIAAWASEQSEPLEAYTTLEERFEHFDARFEDDDVPRPHSWGGYLLTPARVEFWQGRPNRMHERVLYTSSGTSWTKTLLQP